VTRPTASTAEHLLQLLADRVTEGLDSAAEGEVQALCAALPEFHEAYFEPAAAAVDLALADGDVDPLPAALRARVLADAERWFAGAAAEPAAGRVRLHRRQPRELRGGPRWSARAGWYLAAAAGALALVGWWQALMIPAEPPAEAPRTYAAFVAETPDAVHASWAGLEPGYAQVRGEAVWSDARQAGYLRLVGLPPNDAARAQYQLWIVDPDRDVHPVDGGVFDVAATGEVVVPIHAKLAVDHPTTFAITLEQPGGVVVSGGPLLVAGNVAGQAAGAG